MRCIMHDVWGLENKIHVPRAQRDVGWGVRALQIKGMKQNVTAHAVVFSNRRAAEADGGRRELCGEKNSNLKGIRVKQACVKCREDGAVLRAAQ